jgi:hypothetical protein
MSSHEIQGELRAFYRLVPLSLALSAEAEALWPAICAQSLV